LDWEEFLGILESELPMLGHEPGDPMMKIGWSKSPVGQGNGEPAKADATPEENVAARSPIKILCIDDDPVVIQSINLRLGHYGIHVVGADNGIQGYMTAASQLPDIILLDLKMPNGEGPYVLTKLKNNQQTKNIPILILTVESNPGVQRKMLSMGAEAFLTKPVRWSDLFETMERFVQLPERLVADYRLTKQLAISQA
jgi:CheY-like chemotaxis protein